VINSLWEVSDAGTQKLMTLFYREMLKGTPIRKAFRETRIKMLDDSRWSHPYYWSAFYMVGM
jgi:CHAT domain-containing protein